MMAGVGGLSNSASFLLQEMAGKTPSQRLNIEGGSIQGGEEAQAAAGAGKSKGPSFLDTLKKSLQEVNEMQAQADKSAQRLASGETQNLHELMIAVEKADVALRTATTVRNKMVEAYQEIMRMPV